MKSMFAILVSLFIIRPFLSSLAYPSIDILYTVVLTGCLIGWCVLHTPDKQAIHDIARPLGLFCGGVCLSLIGSTNTATSMLESLKFVPCILFFIATPSFDKTRRSTLLTAIIFTSLGVCCLAAYQYIFGFRHLQDYMALKQLSSELANNYLAEKRVFLPFITPTVLAGYCAMIAPLCLANRRFYWIMLPLAIVIILTKSLGALIALLAATFVCAIVAQKKFKTDRIVLLLSILATIGALFVIRLLSTPAHTPAPGSARLAYWRDAWAVIQTHPMLGTGLGNMNLKASMFTHNSFLQLWAEAGIISLAGFCWLLWAVMRRALAAYNASKTTATLALIGACAVFIFHNLVDFTLFLPEVSLIWWALLGMLL